MVRSWLYLHIRLISTRQKSRPKVRSKGQRSRSNMQLCKKSWAINHERIIGFWWYLYIWSIYTSSCIQWSQSGTVASRRVEVRFYKHLCPCDYSCYKTWIDGSILIILTNKIYISETKKLTLGHGHGQGKVKYVIIQKFVLTINHERMIGFWSYLYIWLISMSTCF